MITTEELSAPVDASDRLPPNERQSLNGRASAALERVLQSGPGFVVQRSAIVDSFGIVIEGDEEDDVIDVLPRPHASLLLESYGIVDAIDALRASHAGCLPVVVIVTAEPGWTYAAVAWAPMGRVAA